MKEIMETLAAKIEFEHNAKVEAITDSEIVAKSDTLHISVMKLEGNEDGREWVMRMTPKAITQMYDGNWPWAVEHFASSYNSIYATIASNEWDYRAALKLLSKEFAERCV